MSAGRSTDARTADAIAPADVLRQLERILAHPLFHNSHRLCAFLRFAVHATLAGESRRLKEHGIGVDVFERGSAFDPAIDNVVRVSANRIRSKLAEYYLRDGQFDSVVIDLPRGRYIPQFARRPSGNIAALTRRAPLAVGTSVGRLDERESIHAAFGDAIAGSGSMLSILADTGMGKTTIVEDFLSETAALGTDVRIARGRCSERLAKTDAFVPIFDCLDDLTRGELGADAKQVMKAAAPSWLSQLSPNSDLGGVGPSPRAASAERMRREFAHFFEELSALRPVVLFLDDIHWADASTCDLLAYFAARMRGMRMLVVATARPSELLGTHPFAAVQRVLEREKARRAIVLDLLTRADIRTYLDRRFPSNSFGDEFADLVYERTEGNPLFMSQMVDFLVDNRMLTCEGDRWDVAREPAEIRKLIPTGTQNMIRMKIDQFSELDRRILQCAAIQGIEFDSAIVSRVLSIDAADLEERLQSLEQIHRFVHTVGPSDFGDRTVSIRYRFAHVLYQNALYADLVPSRRSSLSLAVAESVVSLTARVNRGVASQVALLFENGRDYARAAQYFLSAARNAVRAFAYPEAALLCTRGLNDLRSLPESRERDARELELSITLGMAQMVTGGYAAPDAEQTYRRCRELCIRLDERKRLVQVLWGLHTSTINAGRLVPALELAQEMGEVADALGDPASIIQSLHALGTTLAFMGNVAQAREALERIFDLSPIGQHRYCGSTYVLDPCVTSLSMLARVLARAELFDQALENAVLSVRVADELKHAPSAAYAIFWVGWIRHARHEHVEACRQLENAMELGHAHGLPQILEWARVVRGSSLAHLGRGAEGVAEIRRSLEAQEKMRSLLERPYCFALLSEALLLTGEHREALTLCDDALRLGSQTGGRSYEAQTLVLRERIVNDASARLDRSY